MAAYIRQSSVGVSDPASTTHDVLLTGGAPISGNLLIVHFTPRNYVYQPAPTGFRTLVWEDGTEAVNVYVKISDGTESGATFTTASTIAVWAIVEVADWSGKLPSVYGSLPFQKGGVIGSKTTGTSATPDPPNLDTDPVGWNDTDTLWLTFFYTDDGSRSITATPTSYTNQGSAGGGGGSGAIIGLASRQLSAAAENPGPWTIDSSANWSSQTIAIRSATSPSYDSHITQLLSEVGYAADTKTVAVTQLVSEVGYAASTKTVAVTQLVSEVGYAANNKSIDISQLLVEVAYVPSDIELEINSAQSQAQASQPALTVAFQTTIDSAQSQPQASQPDVITAIGSAVDSTQSQAQASQPVITVAFQTTIDSAQSQPQASQPNVTLVAAGVALEAGEFVYEGAAVEFSGTNRTNLGPGSFFSLSVGASFSGTNRASLGTGSFETTGVDISFAGSNRILLGPGDFFSGSSDSEMYSTPRIVLGAAAFATETIGIEITPPATPSWFGPTGDCSCYCSIIPDTCPDNNCYNDQGVKFNQTGFYYEMTKAIDSAQKRIDYYDAADDRHIAYETLSYSGFSILNHSRLIEFDEDLCQFIPFVEVIGRANLTSVQSLFDTYVLISPSLCAQNGPYTRSGIHQIEFTIQGRYSSIGGTYAYYVTLNESWLTGPLPIFPVGCGIYKGGSPIQRLSTYSVVSGDTGDLPFGASGLPSWGAATHCYSVDIEYDPADPYSLHNYFKPITNRMKIPFRSMRFYGEPVF